MCGWLEEELEEVVEVWWKCGEVVKVGRGFGSYPTFRIRVVF